jgi:cytoskeletal protein RodZ
VTLLAPLKHLTALKLSKLPIFVSAVSVLEQFRPKPPVAGEPVEFVPAPPTPSEILQQVGENLRQIRQQRQLSIEDIAARTRIQPRLVQAIEEGHIEMLPEPVYVKGMVKRYGDSIGLDGMAISQQVPNWDAAAAAFEPTTKLQATAFSTPTQVKPVYVYLGYTIAILGVSAVASNFINTAFKPQSQPNPIAVTTPQSAAGVVATPTVTAPQPSQLPDIPVEIVVKSPTWAQIGIDGKTVFTGNLNIGTKFSWTAQKQVTINTNNAGGLVIAHDSLPPQPLGKLGEKQSVTVKVGK